MLQKIKISFQKIPIAWLQLQYQKNQTIAAILGITFSVVLLFMQIGFFAAFLESFIQLPRSFQGEIFIVNTWSIDFINSFTFSSRHLYQTKKFSEVESVTPIYRSQVFWRNFQNKKIFHRGIMVMGIPIEYQVIDLPGVTENLAKLKVGDVVLFDEKSHPKLAYVTKEYKNNDSAISELKTSNHFRKIKVVGLFQLGANTSVDANLIMNQSTFWKIFNREPGQIDLGIIKLKKGADINEVIKKIETYLPNDIKIYSKYDFIFHIKEYYEHSTAMGIIFRFGLIGSIIVCIVILYQILYQKISKHLPDYATLKAIGYSHRALVLIVLLEAYLLANLGYIPGLILSILMYDILAKSTSLAIAMNLNTAISVLVLTCTICFVSAGFAVQKLKDADPADVFI